MKRSTLRRIGKIGRANIEANKRLREVFYANEDEVKRCEINLPGCLKTWPLQFVHRHKRAWYKGDIEKLSDIKQVVIGCQECHEQIEHNPQLTEEVFYLLRGNE